MFEQSHSLQPVFLTLEHFSSRLHFLHAHFLKAIHPSTLELPLSLLPHYFSLINSPFFPPHFTYPALWMGVHYKNHSPPDP